LRVVLEFLCRDSSLRRTYGPESHIGKVSQSHHPIFGSFILLAILEMKRPGIEIAQNQPRFGIWAGDLRSRSLHVDLHAELHDVKNRRPADSAPFFARLARFSF